MLCGMAAVTTLSLVVLLNHQGMTVPATPPLPGGMGRVDEPSSRGFGSTPHPTGSSTHRSMRGAGDSFGAGSSGLLNDGAATRPGASDSIGGASSDFEREEGAAARRGGGRAPVARRDRLGSRTAWRDHDRNGHDGQHGVGNSYDEKPTQPPLRGASDKRETAAEANERAVRAQNDALFTGGGLAGGGGGGDGGGGGGGGGKAKKKHTAPISQKARSAAKAVGAPGIEEEMASRVVGRGAGHANEAAKALTRRKASTHVTRTADREVMAEQAVLKIISSRENSGRQQRKEEIAMRARERESRRPPRR